MQTTFPNGPGYSGMFSIGVRKGAGFERVGTVVLKRGYDVAAGTLTPSADALPVLQKDQPFNLVFNGDFELSLADVNGQNVDLPDAAKDPTKVAGWDAATSVVRDPQPAVAGMMTVKAAGGTTNDVAATQSLQFEQPLAGRTFTLSYTAWTDVGTLSLKGADLEVPNVATICDATDVLTTAPHRFARTGSWAAAVDAKEANVVLHSSVVAQPAFYDQVQVEEIPLQTEWGPETIMRYEHDLAPVKPEADVIVLGHTDQDGVCRVVVDVSTWLQRTLTTGPAGTEKALFGWQTRNDGGVREALLGTQPADPVGSLRPDFDNGFFNGYRRDAKVLGAPFVVPSATSRIKIQRDGPPDEYAFDLPGEIPIARLSYYGGEGADEPTAWQTRNIDMVLDTIILEPEVDRCHLVWRGAWPWEEIAAERYRRLDVAVSS